MGRPNIVDNQIRTEVLQLLAAGWSVRQVENETGLSKTTVHKISIQNGLELAHMKEAMTKLGHDNDRGNAEPDLPPLPDTDDVQELCRAMDAENVGELRKLANNPKTPPGTRAQIRLALIERANGKAEAGSGREEGARMTMSELEALRDELVRQNPEFALPPR